MKRANIETTLNGLVAYHFSLGGDHLGATLSLMLRVEPDVAEQVARDLENDVARLRQAIRDARTFDRRRQ